MWLLDDFLHRVTMYRLVVYVLAALTVIVLLFAFTGHVPFAPTSLVISAVLLVGSSYVVDRLFGRLFHAPTNMESALISGLILFLIVQPANSLFSAAVLVAAGALASASKFLITYNGKHLFNPAALAAAVLSLTGLQAVTWWVGGSHLWPVSLVLGLLVIRKLRRFSLWAVFIAVSVTVQYALFVHMHLPLLIGMKQAITASPLIFMSTIMLTEPATMPSRRNMQVVFAALVAILYVTAWKFGSLVVYPEVALLVGNLFAFAVSPKFNVRMQLKEVQKISDRVYNYVFLPDRQFNFLPGQYLEWTLADVPYDNRGNRRTFTIASSPTESNVQLGVKFYEPASMYKSVLHELRPGAYVRVSQLAGNFTLRGHHKKPLAFIAGGIGITPFRSMITYLRDNNIQSNVVLLYVVNNPADFVYVEELKAAQVVGVRTILIVTDMKYQAPNMVTSKLTAKLIARLVPDFNARTFYISGSDRMVDSAFLRLRSLHVPRRHIKTDHFSGY